MLPIEDYVRNAELIRCICGDKFDVRIDCGFRIWSQQKVRLLDVSCIDPGGPRWREGEQAKRFSREWLEAGKFAIRLCFEQVDGGYTLAEVWRGEESLTTALLRSGNAVPYVRDHLCPRESLSSAS